MRWNNYETIPIRNYIWQMDLPWMVADEKTSRFWFVRWTCLSDRSCSSSDIDNYGNLFPSFYQERRAFWGIVSFSLILSNGLIEYINKTNDILTRNFSGFLFLAFALLGILGLTCTPLSWLLAVAGHTRNCFCILQNLSISPNSHWLWKNFYPSWNFITRKSNKPYHSATIKICIFTRWLDFC